MKHGHEFITSRDALVAALRTVFEHPHWISTQYAQGGAQCAAPVIAGLMEISLSAHPEHIPRRDKNGNPVPRIDTEGFFR